MFYFRGSSIACEPFGGTAGSDETASDDAPFVNDVASTSLRDSTISFSDASKNVLNSLYYPNSGSRFLHLKEKGRNYLREFL